jgi:hypothetical protein
MKRFVLSLGLLALLTLPARAHFVWLLPDADRGTLRMVFSDTLAPDENADLLEKIKQTQVWTCDVDGTVGKAKFQKDKDAFAVTREGKDTKLAFAVCRYGVFQRGDADPALLTYYAKALVGAPPKDVDRFPGAAAKMLDLDIVFTDTPGTLRVLWKGKPLPQTKVFITAPGGQSTTTTDKEGNFQIAGGKAPGAGRYGVRVGHTVKEAGELEGKKYAATRHWATFVFAAGAARGGAGGAGKRSSKVYEAGAKEGSKEDPEASKLLADARAARANWDHFPGFSADVELNVEGKVVRGKVDVDSKGKVTVSGIEDDKAQKWIHAQLESIVGHRLSDGTELSTPCAFKAEDAAHPLGRMVQVLNGEFHSSYRIRDRQVIVVNRTMTNAGIRFSIVVMENKLNAEKKYLPTHYVVETWDLKTNALRSSRSFHHEWVRVGTFDLPATSLIVTGGGEGQLEARKLTLSNHKLK